MKPPVRFLAALPMTLGRFLALVFGINLMLFTPLLAMAGYVEDLPNWQWNILLAAPLLAAVTAKIAHSFVRDIPHEDEMTLSSFRKAALAVVGFWAILLGCALWMLFDLHRA